MLSNAQLNLEKSVKIDKFGRIIHQRHLTIWWNFAHKDDLIEWRDFSCLVVSKRILRSCYYSAVVEWVLRQSNAEKKLELDDITVYAKRFARCDSVRWVLRSYNCFVILTTAILEKKKYSAKKNSNQIPFFCNLFILT